MLDVKIEKILPVTEVRDSFNQIIDEVESSDELYVVTKNGKPSAVIVGVHHLEKLTGQSSADLAINSTETQTINSPDSNVQEKDEFSVSDTNTDDTAIKTEDVSINEPIPSTKEETQAQAGSSLTGSETEQNIGNSLSTPSPEESAVNPTTTVPAGAEAVADQDITTINTEQASSVSSSPIDNNTNTSGI